MKKTLVALAALAATSAFAQSSVAITGVVDAGYQSITHTNATKKWSGINNNSVQTSRFDFQGTEDLGGGLKASFWAELDHNPVRSSTLNQAASGQAFSGTPFTGQQFVGIAGGFGDLKLGQPNSPALDIAGGVLQPFGTNLGSGYSGGWGRLGTEAVSGVNTYVGGASGRVIRHSKTALYTTPTMSGFKAQVEYSFQNDKSATVTSNDNGYQSISAHYSNGPLNASVLSAQAKSGAVAAAGTTSAIGAAATAGVLGTNSDVKWTMAGGNYTMGALTGYVGYTTTKATSATATLEESKSSNVSAKYVMGQVDLLASYITRKSSLTAPTGALESKLTAVGANYNLSKMTTVYYRYENLTGLTSIAANEKQTTNAIGMWVKF